jgi:iron complex outermembrane recepter protein
MAVIAVLVASDDDRGGGICGHERAGMGLLRHRRAGAEVPMRNEVDVPASVLKGDALTRARGGTLGDTLSWADADGYVGLAIDRYRNNYGVTVEPDVTIDMKRERALLAGERKLGSALERIEFQASHTRYEHQEIEGSGDVGTTFTSSGNELRVQGQLAPWLVAGGALRGVVGTQFERLDFSALGDEAFVPNTSTRSGAAFLLEEWKGAAFSLTGGLRAERASVKSEGDSADAGVPRFGAASERRFARLDNVGDVLAFNAAALRTARDLSPLPARSATLGLRVAW